MNTTLLRLIAAAQRAGVLIEHDNTIPTACACIERGAVRIKLGALYRDAPSDDHRATLLTHELAHVLRGDLRVKDKDARRWNIAADAAINEGLPQQHIADMSGIRYAELRDELGMTAPVCPGALPVYQALVQHADDAAADSWGDIGADDGSVDDVSLTATRLKLRAECADMPELANLAGKVKGHERVTPVEAQPIPPALLALVRALRAVSHQGALTRERSYAREGRTPLLRGVIRRPRARVLVALDVSGSMTDLVPRLAGLAHGMRQEVDASVAVWADRAAMAPQAHAGALPDVGGGTDPSALCALPLPRYDAVIIVTDGQFAARAARRVSAACKRAVWILTAGGARNALPADDTVIEL